MSEDVRSRIAERLRNAQLSDERFVDVVDGEKKSVDHERHPPDAVTGNYGIYAHGTDDLVFLDIDDYGDLEDTSGYDAINDLPETFEQESPHGGTHKFYAVDPTDDGRLVAAALGEAFGNPNLKPTWGEVRVKNQYVVGAASQLDGCGKDWCDQCAEDDGGYYRIKNDASIARISADELIDALEADPNLSKVADTDAFAKPSGSVSHNDVRIYDVLSHAYERGRRHAHPTHGSETGQNFQVDEDDETWRCWRHSVTGGPLHLLGMQEGIISCGDWSNGPLPRSTWAEIFEAARERGLDVGDPPNGGDSTSEFDEDEVKRGEAILRSQTTPEEPVGSLNHENGCYGIWWEKTDNDGTLVDRDFQVVTNFTLETLSILDTEESETSEFVIRVNPNHPTDEPYTVRVEPAVFNSGDTFRSEVVTGRTTWFDPSNRQGIPTVTILRYLRETVAAQAAPRRTGQPYIGLADDGTEFVTPVGSLTADGWSENPQYEFYSKGGEGHTSGPLEQKWELDPEDTDYDDATVARICELIGNARDPERGLSILGWFYTAPIKALIHGWEHEFPLLAPHGDTGTGKTSIIETYIRAFGGTGEPLSATDTKFTKEKHLAESRGFPIWIDEYKPTEMSESYRNHLHQRLKEVTKERTMPKGRPDLGMTLLHMRAPVVMSGEQKVSDPAVRRRSILTNLTSEPTQDGTPMRAAFGELTGTSYEDADGEQHYPDGLDLGHHALAYYTWVLGTPSAELRDRWNDAGETVKALLERYGVTLGASEQRGLQTVVFGCWLHRAFAIAHGADEQTLPTDQDIEDACLHVVENVGKDGQRREHADEFLEALSLGATEGYVEHGTHHRVLESSKYETEVLAVHMPSCFSAVKRFVRDSNLEDQYNLLSKTDYVNSFANKAESPDSYVIATNKQTRGIENGRRAIHFEHEAISDKLGGDFNIDVFRPPEERGADEDEIEGSASIAELTALPEGSSPYQSITVEVLSWYEPTNDRAPVHTGVVQDTTGTLDLVDWFGCTVSDEEIEEGECYLLEQVRVGQYEGATQLEVVRDTTTATPIQKGAGHTGVEATEDNQQDLGAVPDGGAETADPEPDENTADDPPVKRVLDFIREQEPIAHEDLLDAAEDLDVAEEKIAEYIEKFKMQGQIMPIDDGRYQTT